MSYTKGRLIAECLQLMNDNNDAIDTTSVSYNGEYKDRLINIIPCINRALYRIKDVGRLPKYTVSISCDTPYIQKNNNYTRYSLKDITDSKYSDLLLITKETKNGDYFTFNHYRFEGSDILVLPTLKNDNEMYIVTYNAIIEEVTNNQLDTSILPYADIIYAKIPYFVKAELYEEDNANISAYYRDLFDNYIITLPSYDVGNNIIIENIYEDL